MEYIIAIFVGVFGFRLIEKYQYCVGGWWNAYMIYLFIIFVFYIVYILLWKK